MQYVGRLVSSVYNTIPAMSINAATLSGAIDIIVVERQVEIECDSDSDSDLDADDDDDHDDDRERTTPEVHSQSAKTLSAASEPLTDQPDSEPEAEPVGPPPGWPRGLVWHPPPPPPTAPTTPSALPFVPDLPLSPSLEPATPLPLESESLASTLDLGQSQAARQDSGSLRRSTLTSQPPRDKKRKTVTELSSTPFHVRFGKMSVLRPAERRVTLHLNKHPEPLPFVMKVGSEGEAFFVFETDTVQGERTDIPPEMVTSPVLSAASSPILPPADSGLANEDMTFVPPSDQYDEDLSLDGPVAPQEASGDLTPRCSSSPSLDALDLGEAQAKPHAYTEMDHLDAQLAEFAQDQETDAHTHHHHHHKHKHRDRFNRITSEHGEPYTFDMDGYKLTADGESIAAEEGRRLAKEMHFKPNSRHARARMSAQHRHKVKTPRTSASTLGSDYSSTDDTSSETDAPNEAFTRTFVLDLVRGAQQLRQTIHAGAADESNEPRESVSIGKHDDTDSVSAPESELSTLASPELDSFPLVSGAPEAVLSHAPLDEFTLRLVHRTRVHNFQLSLCGADGVPKSAQEEPPEHTYELKYEPTPHTQSIFEQHLVSYQAFLDDATIASDDRLVVRYQGRYLLWEDHSALLAALSLYRRSLQSVEQPKVTDFPDRSLRATTEPPQSKPSRWSRWWNRPAAETPPERELQDQDMSRRLARAKSEPVLGQDPFDLHSGDSSAPEEPSSPRKVYLKTLRLTSDQLKQMNLRKGMNTITFSVTSSFSGVAVVRARIFLWDASQPIVVSDIDGTITKSDALGHMFTLIGRDWTHQGVAKLFTDITNNGYRIMYLTSRAIGQADTTRDYLKGIKQDNYVLPEGPVIMSPDRLIASLHREVILRKPEVFKMAALRDIARLFGNEARTTNDDQDEDETSGVPVNGVVTPRRSRSPSPDAPSSSPDASPPLDPLASPTLNPQTPRAAEFSAPTPFFAGFGNRITDALSYRSVDIPSSRIFTIDPNGNVKMELLEMAGYNTSYIHMTDLVDQMFPVVKAGRKDLRAQRQFNNFNYWRAPLPEVQLPDEGELALAGPQGKGKTRSSATPVSPALSARSGTSVRSETIGPGASVHLRSPSSPSVSAHDPPSESRRSRFGLLSRIANSSVSSLPGTSPVTGGGAPHTDPATPISERAQTIDPSVVGTSSPQNSSSWMPTWRRRPASPASPAAASAPITTRLTSPLVGPALTAEPEEEDDEDVSDLDEEVLRQPGGHRRMLSASSRGSHRRMVSDPQEPTKLSSSPSIPSVPSAGSVDSGSEDSESESDGVQEGEILSEEEGPSDEDEDPLLTQGEIRFEWRG